jgi:hypothetical protein
MEIGMMGVFLAQDFFLFYIFWEFTLVPMYFLIGIWGGAARVYASIKFFLYTMAGSLLMLLAILYMGITNDTFSVPELIAGRAAFADAQNWLFIGFAIAFAIKVPVFPFHSWLPDAHTEAPTAGSIILAGVLLKMGTYGFMRFNLPLFPRPPLTTPRRLPSGDYRHHLRGDCLLCPEGCEEIGRLFQYQPSWFCDAGHLSLNEARAFRGDSARGESRPQHRRAVSSWSA